MCFQIQIFWVFEMIDLVDSAKISRSANNTQCYIVGWYFESLEYIIAGVRDIEEDTLATQRDLSRIITSEITHVAVYPAQKIVYTEGLEGTSDGDRFKKMKVIPVAFDREYVITYDSDNSDYYEDYISTFEDILKTFQILEPEFDGINC